MEHIKNIHLKNFTCFQDLKIENVNKINIIFGANGTGKTWLLRAIDLIVNFKHIQDINSNRDEISDFDEALLAIIKDFDSLISRKRISEILNKLGFFANSEFSISDDITQKEIGARISRIIRYPDHPRFYRRDRDEEYEFFETETVDGFEERKLVLQGIMLLDATTTRFCVHALSQISVVSNFSGGLNPSQNRHHQLQYDGFLILAQTRTS
jgi:predicted ATPase